MSMNLSELIDKPHIVSASPPLLEADFVGEESPHKRVFARLILAGGMASRLGSEKPKGLVEVPGLNSTLLHFFLKDSAKRAIPTVVMTSSDQLEELRAHGEEIGAPAFFFAQSDLPFFSLEKKELPFKGPSGNGDALSAMKKNGLFEKLGALESLSVIPIDNPRALFAESALLSAPKSEVALAVVRKRPGEKSGGVVQTENGARVIEYFDESAERCPFANTGVYLFDLEFAKRAASFSLPLHSVQKAFQGQPIWKFEQFLFDVFEGSSSVKSVEVSREKAFFPIKESADLASFEISGMMKEKTDCII